MHTDSQESRELFLFAQNDANLYRQKISPIIENLKKKIKKGTYDKVLALKLWKYAADDAAKNYNKEYTNTRAGYGIFTVAIRHEVATLMQDYYDEELHYSDNPTSRNSKYSVAIFYKSGQVTILSHRDKTEFSFGTAQKYAGEFAKKFGERVIVFNADNPIPTSPERHKNPAPRIGTKRPRRVSQITGDAPSKRLVARRKANTDVGYFPNPIEQNKLAIWLNAGNDTNGNPRRLFVVVTLDGNVVSVHDEGYEGKSAVTKHHHGIGIVGQFSITPAQYRDLKKQYK